MLSPSQGLFPRANEYGDMHQYICNTCIRNVEGVPPYALPHLTDDDLQRTEQELLERRSRGSSVAFESELFEAKSRDGLLSKKFVVSAVTADNASDWLPIVLNMCGFTEAGLWWPRYFQPNSSEFLRSKLPDNNKIVFATTLDETTDTVKLAGIVRLEKDIFHHRRRMDLRRSLGHLLSDLEVIEKDKLQRNHVYVGTVDVRDDCQGFGLARCVPYPLSFFFCERRA